MLNGIDTSLYTGGYFTDLFGVCFSSIRPLRISIILTSTVHILCVINYSHTKFVAIIVFLPL